MQSAFLADLGPPRPLSVRERGWPCRDHRRHCLYQHPSPLLCPAVPDALVLKSSGEWWVRGPGSRAWCAGTPQHGSWEGTEPPCLGLGGSDLIITAAGQAAHTLWLHG